MRILRQTAWDMRCLVRYGFCLLYSILTVLYLVLLLSLPEAWRSNAAALLIFSDPAAMGLFFMGAVVLLEKNQHLPCAFAVSPLTPAGYLIAKLLSFAAAALPVSAVLTVLGTQNPLIPVLFGVLLANILFTLIGTAVASAASSLNQFFLLTIPVEALAFLPAVLHLFGISPDFLAFYPTNVCLDLIAGRTVSPAGLLITGLLIAVFFGFSHRSVSSMWKEM